METRTERFPKASNYETALAGHLIRDSKANLHYRNSSGAGIFAPAVVSSFHITPEDRTEFRSETDCERALVGDGTSSN